MEEVPKKIKQNYNYKIKEITTRNPQSSAFLGRSNIKNGRPQSFAIM